MATRGVPVGGLPTWGQQLQQRPEPGEQEQPQAPPPATASESTPPCYPVDAALNDKIVIYEGAPWKLEADALAIHANEALSDRRGTNAVVLDLAGPQVTWDCHLHGRQRTGAAVRTRAGNLPCRALIHAVTPRWSPKYALAAENALHQAYRNALRAALDEGEDSVSSTAAAESEAAGRRRTLPAGSDGVDKKKTVVFSCLYPPRKGYPSPAAAHVALRTLRRFLEHHGEAFDKVVFAFLPPSYNHHHHSPSPLDPNGGEGGDRESDRLQDFLRALPLYFPRDAAEAQAAAKAAAAMAVEGGAGAEAGGVFNEWGERVLDERRIRVASSLLPAARVGPSPTPTSPSTTNKRSPQEGPKQYYLSAVQRQRLPPREQMYIPPTPPMEMMVEDQDARRRAAVRRWYRSLPPDAQEAYRFKAYVSQARQTDLRATEALGIVLGVVGDDRGGRPVVCVDVRAYYRHFVEGQGGKEGGGGDDSEGEEEEEEEPPVGHDALLLWVVKTLEGVRHRPYTLLLLDSPPPKPPQGNTAASSSSVSPSPEWVQELGRLLSSERYSAQLAAVLVLHASWGMKVHLWGLGFNTLLAKAVYLDSLAQLELFVKRDHLPSLPAPTWRRLEQMDAALAHARREQRGQQQAAARAAAAAEGVNIFALPIPPTTAPQLPQQQQHRPVQRAAAPLAAVATYGAALAAGALPPPTAPTAAAETSRSSKSRGRSRRAKTSTTPIVSSADRFAFAFPPPAFSNGPPPSSGPVAKGGKSKKGVGRNGSGGKGNKENSPHNNNTNSSSNSKGGSAAAAAQPHSKPAAGAVAYAPVGGWKRHSLL